jgi:hypothetical protein
VKQLQKYSQSSIVRKQPGPGTLLGKLPLSKLIEVSSPERTPLAGPPRVRGGHHVIHNPAHFSGAKAKFPPQFLLAYQASLHIED